MEQTPSMPCSNCGYQVEAGSPICGNCGHPQSGYTTGTAQTIAAGGNRRGCLIAIVILFVVLGTAIWGITAKIGDFFQSDQIDTITDAFDDLNDLNDGTPGGFELEKAPGPYKGVRALAVALNQGGLRCKKIDVQHADEYVASGSCQVAGNGRPGVPPQTHVQINIFFARTSLEAVENQMQDGSFTFVHDDNWFVITLEPVAKKVHKILGGDLSLTR
ncbi:MAG TPA: zinc ribbon domain-containing protein [Actinomycetota bacterium]|nr:zinc ribbon domain-containing protein [Actinomycetota bacterium]